MSPTEDNLRLEEFKQLRTEILGYQRDGNTWTIALLATTGVIIAAAIANNAIALLLVLPLLVVGITARVCSLRTSTLRVATFIMVYYDEADDLRGTRWETLFRRFRAEANTARGRSPSSSSFATVFNGALGGAAVAGLIIFLRVHVMDAAMSTTPKVNFHPSAMLWVLDLLWMLLVWAAAAGVVRHNHWMRDPQATTREMDEMLSWWRAVRPATPSP